jgi:hypothetical protein
MREDKCFTKICHHINLQDPKLDGTLKLAMLVVYISP